MTCRCGRETRDDTFVCDHCVRRLRRDLGDIPYYAEQLDVTLARQGRQGAYRVGSRSSERPLPFDWTASVTVGTLVNTLTVWARSMGVRPQPNISALCTHMIGAVDWVRTAPEGPQMVDEIRYLIGEIRARVDRPPDWYAGPCRAQSFLADVVEDAEGAISLRVSEERHCNATLWTRLDSRIIVCRECKAKHIVAERRGWLVRQVEQTLVPLNLVVDALPTLIGVTVSRDTARKWVTRGRLERRGLSGDGVELFSGADIMDLARRVRPRRTA